MLKSVSKVGMPARKVPNQEVGMELEMEQPEAEGEEPSVEGEEMEGMDLSALTDEELLAEIKKRGLKV